ncbi:MAG: hypothetical protein OXC11_13020 [Rhodospirillales bacterium]|nr:hypothetical protein [Rhodospirillales bacterium]
MITKAGAQAMMGADPKNRPVSCVIRGHCRTHVFELPKAELRAERPLQPTVIAERPSAMATVVSDLLGYFRDISPFRHYGICCSLRSKINDVLSRREKSVRPGRFPLFVVVEQEQECETTLEKGTCYAVDQEAITGGQAGRKALVAWKTDDAAWPKIVEEEPGLVATVLAAVKIVQDATEPVREVAESSCFYNADDQAVYSMTGKFSANPVVIKPRTEAEMVERAAQIRTLVGTFEAKRRGGDARIRDLVAALRLEKIDTDHYRRVWYLCLFEAIKALLSKRHKHDFYQRHRNYRSSIGHPRPSTTMDMGQLEKLQRDALAELRRLFLND